jgi:hypothetical protein
VRYEQAPTVRNKGPRSRTEDDRAIHQASTPEVEAPSSGRAADASSLLTKDLRMILEIVSEHHFRTLTDAEITKTRGLVGLDGSQSPMPEDDYERELLLAQDGSRRKEIERENEAFFAGVAILKRSAHWNTVDAELCSLNAAEFEKPLPVGIDEMRDRAFEFFDKKAQALLPTVSDNETADAFCGVLPVLSRATFWECRLGQPLQCCRPVSADAESFERKVALHSARAKAKAYERASQQQKLRAQPPEIEHLNNPPMECATAGRHDALGGDWELEIAGGHSGGEGELGQRNGGDAPEPRTETASDANVRDRFFRKTGEIWSLHFDGKTVTITHRIGMTYIGELLRSPRRSLSCLALQASVGRNLENGVQPEEDLASQSPISNFQGEEILDKTALKQYRDRLDSINNELLEAERNRDSGRREKLATEKEMLVDQLKSATGFLGRPRRFATDAEKARKAVSRAIKTALERIKEHHPPLAKHLLEHIELGISCRYEGDDVPWDF